VTYRELFESVRACGGMFRALGVQTGDRIGIAALDCPEFIISFLGSAAIGAVAVPASTMLSASELGYILHHSAAKVAVVTVDQLDKIREVRNGLRALQTVLLVDGQSEDTLNFSEVLSQSDPVGVEPVDDESAAFILYTSGTTGPPKGAVHVHRNLPHTVRTYCSHILQVKAEDRLFSSSRLFFAYGLGNSLSFPLASGASAILCKPRPTPPLIAEIFRQYHPTIFFAVPAAFRALLEYTRAGNRLEVDSIQFCVSAGEKLPERIFHEWREVTGLDILDGIGSTEMLQMFMSNRKDRIKPGSSGRPFAGYEAKIVDSADNELSGPGTGNLMVKGASACAGYWKDPEKTAAAMSGDWMRTGDVYRRDQDGDYWFEGRADDLFKVKGLWVSPLEVEDALLACPEVLEAAVVAGIDADGMNRVVAHVVARDATASKNLIEALTGQVSERLPAYKCPEEIHLSGGLPRTATGKLQRFKLRQSPG